ncbi:valine--tRNA ligase [Nitratiruptor sp. SB155-2]|uniref:Valine--tRNA ligase n=1 Tax=Nitratiruptor sp. (strain SB155-2) TaxID=387092 RepID=SYV_NITSB|nr:valine--tRNA ligase [Nitratiruptor sp. SB155-2]A6Q3R4.1 RecName: Full=Valine--tRNA ligase; AltName: Full=Valyl-tRNA synthetase; Short=ValRS [Nitratiruptor sp. SB155-2]BAF70123.1 valyl-tRNA synthetase [Nitratiruptor sp. SB155-2]
MSKATKYDPKKVERQFYQIWETRGYFETDGNKKIQNGKTFCIMMPPPNVTGRLHIGHALTFTLQDIMVRYKRMDGYETLWQPGTDHAGIATQNVVEKQLLSKGIKKEEIGREKFLEYVWKWKEESGNAIVTQLRLLGVSPAWSRERFTMDKGLKNAVREAFVNLYYEGLIVKGNYMINWCTHDGALSDIEVEYEEKEGALYHIKYPIVGSDEYLVVATTRPETYFGDTAVMVNPNDERYKHLIGKKVRLPLINREIPIIADEHVDMEFGTGAVKVTPAHDPNDYEVGKRHNLPFITIFDENGILNEEAGEFAGIERLEARKKVVEKLEQEGFIEKIEPHKHQVGHCYRCGNVVEPYISPQWFVKAEIAKEAVKKANEGETKFYPPQWLNNFNAWMRELRDWCISRQLWWGHRIPVWYCRACGHEWASKKEHEESCPKCGSTDIYQDPDVLDTWFSSALWPFSTLGWGNGDWGKGVKWFEDDLKKFYPNDLLITGFDILFFWVARMMMMGEHFLHKLPFKDVYLHALVRDEHGQKMSKSRGNVIDPIDTIEEYSADALRFTLAALAVQGRDIRLSKERLELYRNFTNKLYNAARFLQIHQEKFDDLQNIQIKTDLGKYILSRFGLAIQEVRNNLNSYRFNDAATTLYRFLWGEFCDWGIELSKVNKDAIAELGAIFKESMKLLHPFMPFITEFLYQELSGTSIEENESIMIQPYPKAAPIDEEIMKRFETIIDAIVSIRRAKALIDMANKTIPKVLIKGDLEESAKAYISKLAKVETIEFVSEPAENAVTDIGNYVEVFIPLEGIDLTPILNRLNKQKEKLQKEIDKLSRMLSNENFVKNAPQAVVEQNRAALAEAQNRLATIEEELARLTR